MNCKNCNNLRNTVIGSDVSGKAYKYTCDMKEFPIIDRKKIGDVGKEKNGFNYYTKSQFNNFLKKRKFCFVKYKSILNITIPIIAISISFLTFIYTLYTNTKDNTSKIKDIVNKQISAIYKNKNLEKHLTINDYTVFIDEDKKEIIVPLR